MSKRKERQAKSLKDYLKTQKDIKKGEKEYCYDKKVITFASVRNNKERNKD